MVAVCKYWVTIWANTLGTKSQKLFHPFSCKQTINGWNLLVSGIIIFRCVFDFSTRDRNWLVSREQKIIPHDMNKIRFFGTYYIFQYFYIMIWKNILILEQSGTTQWLVFSNIDHSTVLIQVPSKPSPATMTIMWVYNFRNHIDNIPSHSLTTLRSIHTTNN